MQHELIGKSLPSAKYGAWIVNEVRGSRARLLTGDMKGEMWMDVTDLREFLEIVEEERKLSTKP